MKTQQKKQNQKRPKQKTKSNPREEVIRWVKEFVEVPHPMFADYPPCPYAKQARLAGKVDFVELTDMEPDSNIWTSIDHFDFNDKDVLVIIAEPDQYTAKETVKIADKLNRAFMPRDVVVLEDHPKIQEHVKKVKLNNGHYILFLVQRLSKLNRYSKMLEKGPYYRNWSKSYLKEVKGFRDPAKTRS